MIVEQTQLSAFFSSEQEPKLESCKGSTLCNIPSSASFLKLMFANAEGLPQQESGLSTHNTIT
jgi:hypothetical protein